MWVLFLLILPIGKRGAASLSHSRVARKPWGGVLEQLLKAHLTHCLSLIELRWQRKCLLTSTTMETKDIHQGPWPHPWCIECGQAPNIWFLYHCFKKVRVQEQTVKGFNTVIATMICIYSEYRCARWDLAGSVHITVACVPLPCQWGLRLLNLQNDAQGKQIHCMDIHVSAHLSIFTCLGLWQLIRRWHKVHFCSWKARYDVAELKTKHH